MLSYLGAPILGDPIYVRRLINIDGELAVVEPKDLHRSINKQVIKIYKYIYIFFSIIRHNF